LKKQSKLGAIAGTLGGLASGLTAWLVAAKTLYGELTVTTTESSYATLAGIMAGVLIGLFLTVVISYIKPDNFDQKVTRQINTSPIVGTSPAGLSSGEVTLENEIGSGTDERQVSTPENPPTIATGETTTPTHPHDTLLTMRDEEKEALEDKAVLEDPTKLNHVLGVAWMASTGLTLTMCHHPTFYVSFTLYILKGLLYGVGSYWLYLDFPLHCSLVLFCQLLRRRSSLRICFLLLRERIGGGGRLDVVKVYSWGHKCRIVDNFVRRRGSTVSRIYISKQ
jgi:hypothetical protein